MILSPDPAQQLAVSVEADNGAAALNSI